MMAERSGTRDDARRALTDRFADALALTFRYHGLTFRKRTQIPYMAHLMSVSALAMENAGAEDVAIAALLHDAAEDSDDGGATLREIESMFGARVAEIVRDCSDAIAVPGRLKAPWRERKDAYIAHLDALHDRDVLLVSLCDKVHNLRAILSDYAVVGEALWERFTTKNPADQLWYYRSLAPIYTAQLPGRLSDELNKMVTRLEAVVGCQASTETGSNVMPADPLPLATR